MKQTNKTETYVEKITLDGQIHVVKEIIFYGDGEKIGSTIHRHVVDVGDDVSKEVQMVKDVAKGVHTTARIEARIKAKDKVKKDHEKNDTITK